MSIEARHNNKAAIYLGPDVYAHKWVVLPPHEITPVTVHVPELSTIPHKGDLFPSVRSRFAQVGITVTNEAPQRILEAARMDLDFVTVPVEVLSERPIKLHEGTNFMRLYEKNGASFFSGRELEEKIDTKAIRLTGQEGTDWNYWVANGETEPSGIELMIDPDSRMWIPPHPENEPIVLDAASGVVFNYRTQLEKALEPISDQTPAHYLGISHTLSEVHLTEGIQGWIDTSLAVDGNLSHVPSVLLNDYDTNWKIRFENKIKNKNSPDSAVVVFSHTAHYARN